MSKQLAALRRYITAQHRLHISGDPEVANTANQDIETIELIEAVLSDLESRLFTIERELDGEE